MTHTAPRNVVLALTFAALPILADTLVLRDGKEIRGTFLGATARQIEFLPTSGKSLKVAIDTVQTVNFSEPQVVVQAPPRRPAARAPVTIPAGTIFRVRTIDFIDVDYTQAGAKFRGAIDDPNISGGDVIVGRGSDVLLVASKVEQGGRMKGSDLVELKVNYINVDGRSYPVVTSASQTKSAGE